MDNKGFTSLFKVYFVGFMTCTILMTILIAVLHPFGLSTVTWNGREVVGVMAVIGPFIGGFLLSLFFSLIFGFTGWLGYKVLGLRKRH